jgi:hypothetical protein
MRPPRAPLQFQLPSRGKEEESAKELADSARRDGDPDYAAAIEKAFAEGGNTGLQQMRLKRLELYARKAYVSPIAIGMAYGRLRDKKKTIEWLEKAYQEHSPRLVRMWMESEWKWLQGDREFRALARRVGLVLPLDRITPCGPCLNSFSSTRVQRNEQEVPFEEVSPDWYWETRLC